MIKFRFKPFNVNYGKRHRSFMSSNEIRKRFVDYFVEENGHKFIKSSPVVPYNDPSIAFVNAGMCQFKNVLLGHRTLATNSVANSQKCIRVGGRHNDLNVVGSDGYHHTFFEMLGNWSFGHYGKAEACGLAWNLLTSPPFNIPVDQLYCTVFNGDKTLNIETDDETRRVWKQIGVRDDHIIMNGANDNFWEMGETGPCGPCTEIHIDYPPSNGKNLIELWNIVFIQYSRERNGYMHKLPNYFIDTGMGLERLTMVLQEKMSTYDTDLFSSLFDIIYNASKLLEYTGSYDETSLDTYYRVLADHGRMITVALSDNMLPSQNHKLRRIMRKSFLITETYFKIQPGYSLICDIIDEVTFNLGNAYPELIKNNEKVKHLVKHEYSIFNKLRTSVSKDWKIAVEQCPSLGSFNPFEECTGFVPACNYLIKHKHMTQIPAFTLYDAFGLERKTIGHLAEAIGKVVDWNELDTKLKQLQTKSIRHLKNVSNSFLTEDIPKTNDSFKYNTVCSNSTYESPAVAAKLLAIVDARGSIVTEPNIKEHGVLVSLVLDKTNFYCQAGGQQNDIGFVKTNDGKVFDVIDVEKSQETGVVLHYIKSNDWPILLKQKELTVQIDAQRRLGLMRAHSSVHILNSVLNSHLVVTAQTSSHVNNDVLSFSFALFGQKFTPEDALMVEEKVISVVQSGASITRTTMTSNDLNHIDVTLLPGEVYPDDKVHVIDIYNKDENAYISREACCGTHVQNTSDLIDFCIVHYKCLSSECTLMAITGPLCTDARNYGENLLEKSNAVENLVNATNSDNVDPKMVCLFMDYMDELKSKLKNTSQNYVPLGIQLQVNKKMFALERKMQKLLKEKKKHILEDAVKKLCGDTYAVGRIDCDTAYFADNCFDFDDVVHVCGDLPCLFLVYNKDTIHTFLCTPKEFPEDKKWLDNLWNKFGIKPIKFKNKVTFKVRQTNKCQALELINDIVQDAKNNYFNNIIKR